MRQVGDLLRNLSYIEAGDAGIDAVEAVATVVNSVRSDVILGLVHELRGGRVVDRHENELAGLQRVDL